MSKEFPEFIEFELSTPIKGIYQGNHSDNNKSVDCKKLYLKANSPRHKEQTRELKRLFLRAVALMARELGNNKKSKEDEEDDNKKDDGKLDKAWILAMFQLTDIDLNKYVKIFKRFALKDICYTDKDFKHLIKSDDFDNLSEDDDENLIASYLEVFFIHSWFPTSN